MIFLTGDLHLNHENIIKYANRPFSSLSEMNQTIIENWQKTVSSDDTVYVNGDFVLGPRSEADDLIKALPGKKILIMGNHDVPKRNGRKMRLLIENLKYDPSLFESIIEDCQSIAIPFRQYTFSLSHYPVSMHDVTERTPHEIFLVGHSHRHADFNMANMAFHIPVYDIGVDANDYKPISIDDLFERIKAWTQEGAIHCNKCGKPMQKRQNSFGFFLGCSGYPNCQNIYSPLNPNS